MENFFWGNRWWKSEDLPAFKSWLQKHGASYSSWANRHPDVAKRVFGGSSSQQSGGAGVSADDLFKRALGEAQGITQSQIDQINKARAQVEESQHRRAQNTAGFYQALAQMMGSVAPATADVYKQATGSEAAIGKGFADAQAAIQSGEANDMSSFLGKIGAPQEQVTQVLDKVGGPGAADVVYGLGAALPATALNREGAAFGAAAAHLPAMAAGSGMDALRQQQSGFKDELAPFDTQLSDTLAGLPKTTQDILNSLQESDRAERALRLQENYYGQTVKKNTSTNRIKTQELKIKKQEEARKRAKDKADAKAKAAAAKADRDKAAADAKKEALDARTKANNAREAAFTTARQQLFTQAKTLRQPMTADEKFAWVIDWNSSHPNNKKKLSDAPQYKGAGNYAAAKKNLFNQYKDLLRYSTNAGRPALKRRLNQMIDEALAAAGITPPKARPTRTTRRSGPVIRPNPNTVGGRTGGD